MNTYLIVIITFLITFFFIWNIHSHIKIWKISKNRKQGKKGESHAVKWLSRHGFTHILEQVTFEFTWRAGGKKIFSKIRPDLFAEKNGVKWLIEVKTGDAASLKNTKTRRQLREYSALYPNKKCALFDATKNILYEIDFNSNNTQHIKHGTGGIKIFLWGFISGAGLVFLYKNLF